MPFRILRCAITKDYIKNSVSPIAVSVQNPNLLLENDMTLSLLLFFILEEELHRLPRQEGSSSAYLLQTAFDTGHSQYRSSYKYVLIFLLLLKIITSAM